MNKVKRALTRVMLISIIAGIPFTGCTDTKSSYSSENSAITKGLADLNEMNGISDDSKKNKVNLKFTYWGTENEKKAMESVCRKFSKRYPWITVDTTQIFIFDYARIISEMAAGGDYPDIGYMGADLGEIWANQGKFTNLFDMFEKDKEVKKEDYLDNLWYKISPDNAWGISSAGESYGLYYNKDLLTASGIASLPTKAEEAMNWDEFINLAKKLTIDKNGRNGLEPNFDPNSIKQYGVMFYTWDVQLISNFIFSNGGEWVSKDGKEFMLNKPEAVEALQKLSDLINVYHVAPSPEVVNTSMPSMLEDLQSKQVAMAITGQWMNADIGNGLCNYDIGVLPKMKKSVTVFASGATVLCRESKNQEEAWLLFKWLSNPEDSIELYSSGLWMPTLKKWYSDPALVAKWLDANPMAHPPGFKDAMMNQLIKNGVPSVDYYLKNLKRVVAPTMEALNPVWAGKKTAADALNEVEPKIRSDINGRYATR